MLNYRSDQPHRYHLPEHLGEHVDYITPGIKLFAPGRPSKGLEEHTDLEKRTFGVTSPGHHLPPVLHELPGLLAELLALPLLSLCPQAITPGCIRGKQVWSSVTSFGELTFTRNVQHLNWYYCGSREPTRHFRGPR